MIDKIGVLILRSTKIGKIRRPNSQDSELPTRQSPEKAKSKPSFKFLPQKSIQKNSDLDQNLVSDKLQSLWHVQAKHWC